MVNLSSGAGALSAAGGQGGWALRSLAYKASKAALNMGAFPMFLKHIRHRNACGAQGLLGFAGQPGPIAQVFRTVCLSSAESKGYLCFRHSLSMFCWAATCCTC